MTCVEANRERGEGVSEVQLVTIPDSLLSVSCTDLGAEQQADPSLSKLFDTVLSTEAGRSAVGGYLFRGASGEKMVATLCKFCRGANFSGCGS